MSEERPRHRDQPPGGTRAWLIWAIGATAFGYAFFHRVVPSVIVQDLMSEFAVSGAVLGNLSAIYFYPYASLQVPIGVLLDRWGARITLAVALTLAAVGSLIFATAGSISLAYVGRFLIGAGSAVGFIGTLMLVSKWFPANRYAFLSGMTMLVAMASAIGSQAPLAAVVEVFGWRDTLLFGAAAGAILAASVVLVVRDHPPGRAPSRQPHETWAHFGRSLKRALGIGQIWVTSLVATAMSGPMLAFGGLWGVPYMIERYDLSRPAAAFFVSLMFLGWAVGAPLAGWFSDYILRRKAPVAGAAVLNLAVLSALFLIPDISLTLAGILIFASGIASSTMVNLFAYGREITSPRVHGAVTGIINGFTVGSAAVLQPVIGWILDLNWDGEMIDGARVYSMAAYDAAMWALIAASALAAGAALFLRETYCQVLWREETEPALP